MAKKKTVVTEDEGALIDDDLIYAVADEIPDGVRRGRGPGFDVDKVARAVIAVAPKAAMICSYEADPDTEDAEEVVARKARSRSTTLKKHLSPYGILVLPRGGDVWAQYIADLVQLDEGEGEGEAA